MVTIYELERAGYKYFDTYFNWKEALEIVEKLRKEGYYAIIHEKKLEEGEWDYRLIYCIYIKEKEKKD